MVYAAMPVPNVLVEAVHAVMAWTASAGIVAYRPVIHWQLLPLLPTVARGVQGLEAAVRRPSAAPLPDRHRLKVPAVTTCIGIWVLAMPVQRQASGFRHTMSRAATATTNSLAMYVLAAHAGGSILFQIRPNPVVAQQAGYASAANFLWVCAPLEGSGHFVDCKVRDLVSG